MRAIVDAKEFSQALDKVSKVIKRSAIPVLGGVLVQVANGRCTLTATDLTTWLIAEIPAQGEDLSFVLLRIKDTARACRHFNGELTLETAESGSGRDRRLLLAMSCGVREAKFHADLPEDYPGQEQGTLMGNFTANAERLLERVEHVKYMLKKPEFKVSASLSHVQFSANDIYALDGYRLAWDNDPKLRVPMPFMALPEALEYLRFFGEKEVSLAFSSRNLQITDGAFTIQTRFEMAGMFNLDGAIPDKSTEEFYVSPKEFLKELTYLKEFIPSTGKPYVCFSNGRLSMRVIGEDYSTAVQIDGESKIEFGFDLGNMIDALRQFRTEPWVKVKVISPAAPIILEVDNRSDHAMVLPIRMSAVAAA